MSYEAFNKTYNSTLGVNNISTYNGTNGTGLKINETARIFGETVGRNLGGGTEMASLIGLSFFAFFLYKSEASTDTSVAIMTPLIFLLGKEGLLPLGQGMIYGVILAVSAIFFFGLVKFTR